MTLRYLASTDLQATEKPQTGWHRISQRRRPCWPNGQINVSKMHCNVLYQLFVWPKMRFLQFSSFEIWPVRYMEVRFYPGTRKAVRYREVSAIQCPLYRAFSMCICQKNGQDPRVLSVIERCPLNGMSAISRFYCNSRKMGSKHPR